MIKAMIVKGSYRMEMMYKMLTSARLIYDSANADDMIDIVYIKYYQGYYDVLEEVVKDQNHEIPVWELDFPRIPYGRGLQYYQEGRKEAIIELIKLAEWRD